MKTRDVVLVSVALLSGMIGGILSRLLVLDNLFSLRFGPVRATRFDLVTKDGRTIASLAPDQEFEAALVFLDHKRRPRALFGTLNGPSAPVLEFRGFDGKARMLAILRSPDDAPSIEFIGKDGRTGFLPISTHDAPAEHRK